MFSIPLYPVFLSLTELRCLIAGFGEVGRRKLEGLLPSRPKSLLVLDPDPEVAARAKLEFPQVQFAARAWTPEDVLDSDLVFAATGSSVENSKIAAFCRETGVLCNNVSAPQEGSFILPAVARRDTLACALSTGGASPLLARRWKEELGEWLESRARQARFMGLVRGLVLASAAPEARKNIFRMLAEGPLFRLLKEGRRDESLELLKEFLPDVPAETLNSTIADYYKC